jgi:hypothetical protein
MLATRIVGPMPHRFALIYERIRNSIVILWQRFKQIIDFPVFLWYSYGTDPQRGIGLPKNITKATHHFARGFRDIPSVCVTESRLAR